ncbi:hypothetical protein [Pleomorphomonas sp. PLEO]|uniref:hypothetical protein n=1 Tax=Pleomorphomonas sp. PLEO TaxID=3239306 RepID=UPI00351EFE5D
METLVFLELDYPYRINGSRDMTMTCLDQSMVRRDRWRAGFPSVFTGLVGSFTSFCRWRNGRVEDLNDHMLRDIGFFDGRSTEAAMRRAAEHQGGMDQF